MNQPLSFLSANNPFAEWPKRFFAMWLSAAVPTLLMILIFLILGFLGFVNEPLLWLMLWAAATWGLFIHTGKYWLIQRTWWQSFKTYGFFHTVLVGFYIVIMFVRMW